MSEDRNQTVAMEVDTAFLKSPRGILKIAEMVTLFAAFVSFTVSTRSAYIAATAMEFVITLLLLLLYLFKLNKKFTFFCWPLIDVFNSAFAAVYLVVLCVIAMATYILTGTLVGGIVGLVCAVLLSVDCYMLFRNITFNKPRNDTQNQDKE